MNIVDLFGQLGAEQQADCNKLLASSSVIFSKLCGVKLGKKQYYLNPDQSGRNSLGLIEDLLVIVKVGSCG